MLKDLKLSLKMMMGFGIVILITVLFAIIVILQMEDFRSSIEAYSENQEEIETAKDLQIVVSNVWQYVTDAALTGDEDVISRDARPNYAVTQIILNDLIAIRNEHSGEDGDEDSFVELKGLLGIFWENGMEMINAYKMNRENAIDVLHRFDDSAKDIAARIAVIVNDLRIGSETAVTEMSGMSVEGRNRAIILCFVIIIVSGVVAFFITSSITKPLKDFSRLFSQAALGDLTKQYPLKEISFSRIFKGNDALYPENIVGNQLCWFEVGSFAAVFKKEVTCPRILKKLHKSCIECQVYKGICTNEISILGAYFNQFLGRISLILDKVKETSDVVTASSKQISQNAQSLSDGAQSQASSLEETTATIEELISSIHTVSNTAEIQSKEMGNTAAIMNELQESLSGVDKQAGEVYNGAKSASDLAQEGNEAVEKTIKGMGEIAESSENIFSILKVINDIADKTNLLALNAAIEAARAGEYGRGFAVVADEISKLADRSVGSTKEIETLITESNRRVKEGMELVNNAGGIIKHMLEKADLSVKMSQEISLSIGQQTEGSQKVKESINSVADLSRTINSVTEEQSVGSKEITRAINIVNDVTQQNASSAEELAAATEELSAFSESLIELVAQFSIIQSKSTGGEETT